MFCMNCGTKLPDGAKFCMNCGTPVGSVGKAAASGSKYCIPGKKYQIKEANYGKKENFDDRPNNEMSEHDIWLNNYVKLEDGTVICWVYQHIQKNRNRGLEDYYYNLYRWNPDGTAEFLNAGSRSLIEEMFVLDDKIYFYDWSTPYRVSLDGTGLEKIEKFPE